MPFAAVYDACVLFPYEVRDMLMVSAYTRLFRVHWSEEILNECTRNLIKEGKGTEEGLSRMINGMNRAFPDANVSKAEYEKLIPSLECQEKDKHVLAVAVCRKADVIVTANHRDFPKESLEPFRVETQSADHFVLNVIDLDDNLFMTQFRKRVEQRIVSAKRYERPLPTAESIAEGLVSEGLRKSGNGMPQVSSKILELIAEQS